MNTLEHVLSVSSNPDKYVRYAEPGANFAVRLVHELATYIEEKEKTSVKAKSVAIEDGCIAYAVPDYAGMVREFHEKFNGPIASAPYQLGSANSISRLRLIVEELSELIEALDTGDIVKTADAIADLLYVVFGTAIAAGIPIDRVFSEVHASNMTKVGGHYEGGKYIKPSTYKPVDLSWLNNL